MPPRQVKPDPEVDAPESPDLSAIQSSFGNTTSQGTDATAGFGLPNVSTTHPLPVIHETEESYFSSQFPDLQGTTLGPQPSSFPYPGDTNINNLRNAFQDPSVFGRMYPTGNPNMSNMSRNLLPSSRNPRNQGVGNSGTGAGVSKRPYRQHGRTGIATNEAVTRAALGMASNQGQPSNQNQGFDVDLTGMNYPIGSPGSMGFYGGALNPGMDSNSYASSSYNPLSGFGGGAQNNPQGQGSRNTSPVPKFDPDPLSPSPDFITPNQYESFGEEEYKPDPRRMRAAEGTPTRASRNPQAPSMALADISPATADVSSPADSSFGAMEQGSGSGAGGSSGRRGSAAAAANNPAPPPPPYQAHVPPNRIAEAGPVTHPDPEWRPYGVNHWHVFLREPTLLKYLSSTEIKDIREHCYGLAADGVGASADDENDDDQENQEPRPVAEGSPYTTADAQAVWKHCDAYVRRRSQVRNNQAARRSRQRKDAETRYWKALAIQYGAPDHEFDWSLLDEDGNAPAQFPAPAQAQAQGGGGGGSSSSRAAGVEGGGGGVAGQTRARARVQQARAHVQGQGQGQARRDQAHGHGQGQAAARRASAPSSAAARPNFDFNRPDEDDEDDKTGNFDSFTGGF